MNLSEKKIGIWGFGIVGKSLVNYLHSKNYKISVLEKKRFDQLSQEDQFFLKEKQIPYFDQETCLQMFLDENDFILPSPGVDLRAFNEYKHKWLSELDIFYLNFQKPIIAITGTVGKTTVTHFISELLKAKGIKAICGGNIGIGMCDLILMQDQIDYVVLEVSSFQLELCKLFAPNLAIWTNFYPNHLDRHDGMEAYFDAKFNVLSQQDVVQKALLPFDIIDEIKKKSPKNQLSFFANSKPADEQLKKLDSNETLFYIEDNFIIKKNGDTVSQLVDCSSLSAVTFLQNWLIICAALELENIDLKNIGQLSSNLMLSEHRMEKFVTINGVDFYNDSKSTIPDSTIAAVNKLQGQNIILFLGGLSKGVDRSNLIAAMKNKVTNIICFGKEADKLKNLCDANKIPSFSCSTIENAVNQCFNIVKPNDKVLFSPSGASFDLFANYKERGIKFKELIIKRVPA